MRVVEDLTLGFLNVRSLHNKVEEVLDLMSEYKLAGLFLAETWHDSDSVCLSILRQKGILVLEKARPRRFESVKSLKTNHGGLVFLEKQKINAIVIDVPLKASTFEFMCVRVSSKLKSFIGLVVYRTGYASCDFFAEFKEIMNIMLSYNEEVVGLGGFNFHLECFADKDAENFKNILHMHDFKSCVAEPTHEQGGWLDVVATKAGFKVDCFDVSFSDHKVLMWKSQLKVPALVYKTFKLKRWKDLDVEKFISKLLNTPLVFLTDLNLDSAVSKYFSTLKRILDELISEKVVRIH